MPPDPTDVNAQFVEFCADRGHDDPAKLSKPLMKSLWKLFHEQRHLERANHDAYGDNLPEE